MSDCSWSARDFYSERFPVARKAHACCECSAPIDKGEKHLRAAGYSAESDGMWDARQHMLCRELCMLMNAEGDGCCYFGGMFEEWREGAGDWRFGPDSETKRKARVLLFGILRREVRASRMPNAAGQGEEEG